MNKNKKIKMSFSKYSNKKKIISLPPLIEAAQKGNFERVKQFIEEEGVNINEKDKVKIILLNIFFTLFYFILEWLYSSGMGKLLWSF